MIDMSYRMTHNNNNNLTLYREHIQTMTLLKHTACSEYLLFVHMSHVRSHVATFNDNIIIFYISA